MYERLKQLQRKAYYYNGEIRSMKGMLKSCWEKGKDPLDINDWQSYSPCTGFHEEEQECDLYSYQKYYAYLLYFRKLLQITETEIKKEKAKIVQAQKANLPTKVYKNKVQVFEGTKRECYNFFKKEVGEVARHYWRTSRKSFEIDGNEWVFTKEVEHGKKEKRRK